MKFQKEIGIFKKEVEKGKRFLILTHRGPDGDAIASSLALHLFLKNQKKESIVFIPQLPRYLKFLPGFSEIITKGKKIKNSFDIIFALDYASKERIVFPQNISVKEDQIITLDHHFEGEAIGKLKIVDPEATGVAEILYLIFRALDVKIDKKIATCLLTGIFADTVNFVFLPKKSFKIVRALWKKADFQKVIYFSERISFHQAKILGKILERMEYDKELSLIYSWLLASEIKTKKNETYLNEPPFFPDFLSKIEGAEIYLFLNQRENGQIKASLRSRGDFDVSKLAKKFGGGGHKKAAAFKIKGDIFEIIDKVKREIAFEKGKNFV